MSDHTLLPIVPVKGGRARATMYSEHHTTMATSGQPIIAYTAGTRVNVTASDPRRTHTVRVQRFRKQADVVVSRTS